eukprot:869263-Rhodomonas_salina.2
MSPRTATRYHRSATKQDRQFDIAWLTIPRSVANKHELRQDGKQKNLVAFVADKNVTERQPRVRSPEARDHGRHEPRQRARSALRLVRKVDRRQQCSLLVESVEVEGLEGAETERHGAQALLHLVAAQRLGFVLRLRQRARVLARAERREDVGHEPRHHRVQPLPRHPRGQFHAP